MDKSNFSQLINKAKASPTTNVIQKVMPLKTKINTEVQFSFYLEKELLKELKLYAIDNDISIKAVINSSINQFLHK